MARRDPIGIRLLTRNGYDWSPRYPLIVEGFDDTLAGYRRAAKHGRHATLDFVPARRLCRCLGRSRAFVSGRGVCVCLDVAEAGGALRANGSLENIFEFLLVKPPRNPRAVLRSAPDWPGWREPLEVRKTTLASLLRGALPGVQFNAHLTHPGDVVFQHACKMGLEGIVSKRLGSRYVSGRSKDWLKFKNPNAPAVKREAEEEWGTKKSP